MTEFVSNGLTLLMVSRRKVAPINQTKEPALGPEQRRWLEQRHPGITRNRVVRLERPK